MRNIIYPRRGRVYSNACGSNALWELRRGRRNKLHNLKWLKWEESDMDMFKWIKERRMHTYMKYESWITQSRRITILPAVATHKCACWIDRKSSCDFAGAELSPVNCKVGGIKCIAKGKLSSPAHAYLNCRLIWKSRQKTCSPPGALEDDWNRISRVIS